MVSKKDAPRSSNDHLISRLDAAHAKHRERVEANALPGETFKQAEQRLREEEDGKRLGSALDRLGVAVQRHGTKGASEESRTIRQPPKGDEQPDFFVPGLYDVNGRDNRSMMDVAVFRLSKRDKRAGELLRYNLPNGYVEVSSGPRGMASIWDYDIVLMLVSHLTEAMNQYREGKGEKPGRVFKPHVSDILKFCRKGDGSRQWAEVEAALDRLATTTIKSVRGFKKDGKRAIREVESESLINGYRVVSRTDTGRIASVEIEVPKWIYREITQHRKPDVLTVHPDYFLIEPGIGRFIYRLARQAAGKSIATWAFRTLHERSGSSGTLKKFTENLRKVITENHLPEYTLREETGKDGPLLVMTHRNAPQELPPGP